MAEVQGLLPFSLTWLWWLLGGGIALLFVFVILTPSTVLYIPDGEKWERVYRRHRDAARRPQIQRWLLLGFLLGGLVAIVWLSKPLLNYGRFTWSQLPTTTQETLLVVGLMAASTTTVAAGGLGAWLIWRQNGRYTPAERQRQQLRRQTERQERQRLLTIKRVAIKLRLDVVQALARQGFVYIYQRQGAMAKASKVEIKTVLFSKDAIYYRIDALPFRKTHTELLEPDVAHNLSLSIGRECRFYAHNELGVWLILGLRNGVAAIPRTFDWLSSETAQNAVEMLPKTKPFTVGIGLGENRKFYYEDARQLPHLLVAGATGGGKSVFLNQMLCTLIRNNAPKQLEILLIDLKGGLEFWQYRGIPHLRRPVVVEPTAVPEALQDILDEKDRRFALFRNAGKRDIHAWNATSHTKLPYIFIFFDEIAALMLNRELKQHVEDLAVNLAEQGRALGLHLVLCTQVPNKAVITTRIKSNITARVAFATDATGSMLILGNQKAKRIDNTRGRAIFANGLRQVEVQCPFIIDEQIEAAIQATIAPKQPKGTITAHDLFLLSIQQYEGNFAWRTIWEGMNGRISQGAIQKIAREHEFNFEEQGPVIDLGPNGRFILTPQAASNRGRRLVSVNGILPSSFADIGLN